MEGAAGRTKVKRQRYRETTPEMLARATAAIDDRLAIALKVAARLLPEVDERRRLGRKRQLKKGAPQAG